MIGAVAENPHSERSLRPHLILFMGVAIALFAIYLGSRE
jgi:hypothetical protein